MAQENVRYAEEYVTNSRGMKLFTCTWIPTNQEPKALIFFCHGYAMECSISMKDTGIRLASGGYAVYGLDSEGHGKSTGLHGFVNDMDCLIGDCIDYFTKVSEREENKKKKKFLLGESMGGAVALIIHRRTPQFLHGAVLVAPMCKIADELQPSPLVTKALIGIAKIIPTWKVVPTAQDVVDAAFRLPETRKEIRENAYCYKGRPRLKTASELMRISNDLEKNLNQIEMPFLVVHGGADTVTDPSVSQLLCDRASSTDKILKMYPGMWHSLLYGETPENVNIVFADIIAWLDQRSVSDWERSEQELKQSCESSEPSESTE